jgi:hypothetical protein
VVAGTPYAVDPEWDRVVRSFIADVSMILEVATEGRGRIGSFLPVSSVRQADVVISPHGRSERAAWADLGALGKTGHIGIYYQWLVGKPREGIALTAAHEFCHYVFGLPDEYADTMAPRRRCPAANDAAGCLMDNYWMRPWYRRFCAEDHNQALQFQGRLYDRDHSCRQLVDRYFAAFGVTSGARNAGEDEPDSASAHGTLAANQPPSRLVPLDSALRDRARDAALRAISASTEERLLRIVAELIQIVRARSPGNTASLRLSASELTYLEVIAREAIANETGNTSEGWQAAALASAHLREPARDSAVKFGTRRTVIVAPGPIDADRDYIAMRSGVERYTRVRDRYLRQFARLIERTRTEFNTVELRQELRGEADEGLAYELDRFAAGRGQGEVEFLSPTSTTVTELLNEVACALEKNELENILVLLPPGGLPPDVERPIEELRQRLAETRGRAPQLDVRLDVVGAGLTRVPETLQHLVDQTGGSVLSILDTSEIGALAQRLKNEQSAGAWLSVPRTFELKTGTSDQTPTDGGALARVRAQAHADQIGQGPRHGIRALIQTLEATLSRIETEQAAGSLHPEVRLVIDELAHRFASFRERVTAMEPWVASLQRRLSGPAADGAFSLPSRTGRILADLARVKDAVRKIESEDRPEAARWLELLLDLAPERMRDVTLFQHGLDRLRERIYGTLRDLERAAFELASPASHRFDLAAYDQAAKRLERGPTGKPAVEPPGAWRSWIYLEPGAELEIILSLSHLPPPARSEASHERDEELVVPRLIDEDGRPSTRNADLHLLRDLSSPTMRVYRLAASGEVPNQAIGRWLLLEFRPDRDFARRLLDDLVRVTTSMASTRPNVELHVAATRRAAAESDRGSTIEVQVYGGAPIVGARVVGLVQDLGERGHVNDYQPIAFRDDGREGDTAADDGIYTVRVPAAGSRDGENRRVLIQAYATDDGATIEADGARRPPRNRAIEPLGPGVDPMRADASQDGDAASAPALRFQRATTARLRGQAKSAGP